MVFIIGLLLGILPLTMSPSESQNLKQEAKRIYGLMEIAKEEAIINAQEMAFAVTSEGYGFEVFSVEGWQPVEEDTVLRNRTLPEQIRMEVSILGEAVDLAVNKESETTSETEEGEESENTVSTRIFFLSSGEMTPFELFLHYETEEDGINIVGNEFGELELKEHKVTL